MKKVLLVLIFLIIFCFLLTFFPKDGIVKPNVEISQPEVIVLPKSNLDVIKYVVTVTLYQPLLAQTDLDPDVLADGTRIKINKAGSYRYCALSRNLLRQWGGPFRFGDMVFIDDVGDYSGWWVVKDTMNARWVNHVDLLTDIGTKRAKYHGAEVWKFERT